LYTRTLETYNVANAEIVDTWEETNLAMLTKINSLDAYMQNWNMAVQEYLANTEEALSTYQDNIDKINDSAGITTTQFENHIDNVVVDLNNLSDDTVQNVSDLSDAMKNEFTNALMEAVLWEQKYVDGMDEMITRNEQFVKSINLMIEALAGVDTDTVSMLSPLSLMENTINQSTMDLYKNTLDQYLSMNKD
jgi:ABC-type transporter Mla subunit MlaD